MKNILLLTFISLITNTLFAQHSNFQLFYSGFSGKVSSLTADNSGSIWAAVWSTSDQDSINEVILINDQIIDTIFVHSAYPIWDLAVDTNNVLWIATQDSGLAKYTGSDLTYIDVSEIITLRDRNNVNCIEIDNENNMWIGAQNGIAKFDGNDWTVYDETNSPLQTIPDIYTMSFDNSNILWFGHYYGVGRLNDNLWSFLSGSPFDYTTTIKQHNNGSVWIDSELGFPSNLTSDTTWIEYPLLTIPSWNFQLTVDTNSVVWFGKLDPVENVVAFDGINFNGLDIPFPEIQNSTISAVFSDNNNNKWFGFANGYLVKYSGDFPTIISADTIPPIISEYYLDRDSLWRGIPVNLTITAIDTGSISSILHSAEMFIDSLGVIGTGIPLFPIDGIFDSTYEVITKEIVTENWSYGFHKLFFHVKDSSENWSEILYASLFIKDYDNNWPMFGANPQHTSFIDDSISVPLKLKWSVDIDTVALNSCAIVNDLVYVTWGGYNSTGGTSEASEISAYNINDGTEAWNYSYGNIFSIDNPAFSYGLIYAQSCNHSSNSFVTAFDAISGQIVWRARYGAQWQWSDGPIVVDNKVFIDAGEYGGMYSYDAMTGDTLWFVSLPQTFSWSPSYYDGNVYSTYVDGTFIKINASTGQIDHYEGSSYYPSYTATISNGRILTIDPIKSIDLETYQTYWSKSGYIMPAVGLNKVYIIDAGKLKVFNEQTGQLLWTFQNEFQLTKPPVLTKNHVFVASDENIFAINVNSHQSEWTYPVSGKLSVANEELFVSSDDGKLYVFETDTTTHVAEEDDIKFNFNLSQNHPNPFNPSTKISYQLPIAGNVTLKVYDLLGREVATLVNEEKNSGNYDVEFNASHLSSGVYIYKIQAGDFVRSRKMILLK